ncbi:MAG: hypothetical protein ABGZ23_12320 [Fuerstiella sp.]
MSNPYQPPTAQPDPVPPQKRGFQLRFIGIFVLFLVIILGLLMTG